MQNNGPNEYHNNNHEQDASSEAVIAAAEKGDNKQDNTDGDFQLVKSGASPRLETTKRKKPPTPTKSSSPNRTIQDTKRQDRNAYEALQQDDDDESIIIK